MTRYAIALGSNLGDRLGHLAGALEEIGPLGERLSVSSLYETEPVGGPDQDPYLNAVAVIESATAPHDLLAALQRVEEQHQRERGERWGPRTLDLDIVASDGDPVDTRELTVPHPLAAQREFVLRPLAEVWPEAPVGEVTAAAALERTHPQGVDLLLRRWVPPRSPWPVRLLLTCQAVLFAVWAYALVYDGSLPDGPVTVAAVVGTVLASTGLTMVLGASRSLGAALRASPEPAPSATLVATGAYRFVRHPIYGGLVLLTAGAGLILDSRAGLAASLLLLAFFWLKSVYEERLLRVRFPGYHGYRKKVGRRLIPFVA